MCAGGSSLLPKETDVPGWLHPKVPPRLWASVHPIQLFDPSRMSKDEGYAAFPQLVGRRARMKSLFPLWRARARRVNSIGSRSEGLPPPLRSPWRSAGDA